MTEITIRDLAIGDIGWLIQQHAEAYALSDGFDQSFETLVAEILINFQRDNDPTCERAFIATQGTQRLGSIFCVKSDVPDVAKLRLFFLVSDARGKGLGKRWLRECMDFARASGFTRMKLWTRESHGAACALYANAGFILTASEPTINFGQKLVEQTWEIEL